MFNQERVQEMLNAVDSIAGKLGSEGSIDEITADLISVKEFMGDVNTYVSSTEEEIAKLNREKTGLQQSNNRLMRKIAVQEDNPSEQETRMTDLEKMNAFFN